ncbi:MAG: beta-glucosidase, partial [Frankiaceae bacterium]|nr:beta-glucosidase [Frankiaceae bacterium]
MTRVSRIAALAALAVVVSGVPSAVATAPPPRSSDEAALAPSRLPKDAAIEQRVNALISQMTLQEKLQQIQLLSDGQITDADARAGVGGVFSLVDPVKINHLQHIAVEQSRLHIPILFAYDTIHGYRTIFPVPLGAASSFDPAVGFTDASIGARETATVGIKQVYSPMLDVSHEPRWGRIAEGNGEDPYVGSVFAAARVKGAQGSNYASSDKVVATPKHFVAYGQPEGGRDYNTTDMSPSRLLNVYLPPFKAAVDAGAGAVMCSFNAINGVPGCANRQTETEILKQAWGFDGFILSDYTAVDELRACPPVNPNTGACGHGVAADGPSAGALALNAGTDQEMVSTNLRDFGAQLLAQNRISMARINDAVRRILRVKFRAGLFDHPYVDVAKAQDSARFLTASDRAAARKAAGESMVLLKNGAATAGGSAVLPLDPAKKTVVIGPLADDQHDMLGPWWGQGKDTDAVSLVTGVRAQSPGATYAQGCGVKNLEPPNNTPNDVCGDTTGFAAAVAAAQSADQVVLALGESREMSGEAASRSDINLPGKQQQLIDAIKATGKPFVVVLFNGRPLTIPDVDAAAPAILEA